MKIILNWLLFIGLLAAVALLFAHRKWIIDKLPTVPQMTGLQVLIFSLACAFAWVDVLRWGVIKPFNCLKCMTGWISILFAFSHHVQFWPLYLPLGLLVGAMFEGIKMRWL
jgi:hypothetical protein